MLMHASKSRQLPPRVSPCTARSWGFDSGAWGKSDACQCGNVIHTHVVTPLPVFSRVEEALVVLSFGHQRKEARVKVAKPHIITPRIMRLPPPGEAGNASGVVGAETTGTLTAGAV